MKVARLLFPLVFLCLAEPALALRCGNKLVSTGDPKAKILRFCGEPVSVERRSIIRGGIPRYSSSVRTHGSRYESSSELLINTHSYVEVSVEEWTYNFGPRRLMRVVIFENGLVRKVKQLGYGYRE
ncbi:MAG: DUF2845 domain-containing protein [Gammaproteobacteria bacterium]|nr:DUF2845 domain-containing protein [Gammaproteobacteria bacterium]